MKINSTGGTIAVGAVAGIAFAGAKREACLAGGREKPVKRSRMVETCSRYHFIEMLTGPRFFKDIYVFSKHTP